MLEFCITVSFICAGIYFAADAIFEKQTIWLRGKLPQFICKPIFDCLPCMSSIWTLSAWILYYGTMSWKIIPAILVVCGMNTIMLLISVGTVLISLMIDKINKDAIQ